MEPYSNANSREEEIINKIRMMEEQERISKENFWLTAGTHSNSSDLKPKQTRKRRKQEIEIAISDSWSSLNDRARKFAQHYVQSNPKSGMASAIYAGYSGNSNSILSSTASHLLADPRVIGYCKFLMSRTALKLNYTKEGQLQKLGKFIDMAAEKKDLYAASKLIDLENKLLGFYQPTTQINMAATGDIKVTFGSEATTNDSTSSEHPMDIEGRTAAGFPLPDEQNNFEEKKDEE